MRVLLAYDASPGAETAAQLVEGITWPADSVIRIVAVIEPSATLVPAMPLTMYRPTTSDEIDQVVSAHLKTEVEGLVRRLTAAGRTVEGTVLRGRPATVLADEAQTFGADILVVGSRGHSTIATLVLGSVSAELVDHAPCPVLVARRAAAGRVLFASDGSPSAGRAEDLLAASPIFEGAAVRVVSVAEVVHPWTAGIAPTLYREAMEAVAKDREAAKVEHRTIVDGVAERLRAAGRSADGTVRLGDAAAQIVEEAAAWQADLVVMGSRGQTGLARLLLGSVARNVLLGSDTSTLIVRDRDEVPAA